MSAFSIGSLAIELTGGGGGGLVGAAGRMGAVSGLTQELVRRILDAVFGGIRKVIQFIKSRLSVVMDERERLSRLDPTMATAQVNAVISKLTRDIGRARFLGPSMMQLTQIVEKLKNSFEPLIQVVMKLSIDGLARLLRVIDLMLPSIFQFIDKILFATQALLNWGSLMIQFSQTLQIVATLLGLFVSQGINTSIGAGIAQLPDLINGTNEAIEEIRKALKEGLENQGFKEVNEIAMNDLRFLTEGATLHTFDKRGAPNRTRIGPGGRDLFGAP